jgi:hypothetical protein
MQKRGWPVAKNLMDEFLKDAQSAVPNTDELMELTALAQMQLDLEMRITTAEAQVDELKEKLRVVQEQQIPDAMSSIGMKKFTLSNGYTVSIREDVYASIRKDFMEQAVHWLDDNGLGDIVKDSVDVKFGRGDSDKAKRLMEYCVNNGWAAQEKMSVHPMTLKAVVKEQLAHGIQFPEEFFSVGPLNKSIIKR